MKKLSLLLMAAISIICFSCNGNDDDDNNDTSIYGVWNVTDVTYWDCDGQTKSLTYSYQISIDALSGDSIIITNLNERSYSYKGIFTGNSLSFTNGYTGSGACSASGIFSNNMINFSLGDCYNDHLYDDYMAACPSAFYVYTTDRETKAVR